MNAYENLLREIPGVSVVTTTYNEVNYIKPFTERVRNALRGVRHEVIIVDDSSPDGTYAVARKYADKAIVKVREGQTKGLLTGIEAARYPIVVTLDVDLENPPELIPNLISKLLLSDCGVLVACRTAIPRVGERLTSKLLGRHLCVRDVYSNFRVYRKESVAGAELFLGETFGAELLLVALRRGYKVCECMYDPPPRRSSPRVGGKVKANIRILKVMIKLALAIQTRYRGCINASACKSLGRISVAEALNP